jgi:hypothetical protein
MPVPVHERSVRGRLLARCDAVCGRCRPDLRIDLGLERPDVVRIADALLHWRELQGLTDCGKAHESCGIAVSARIEWRPRHESNVRPTL